MAAGGTEVARAYVTIIPKTDGTSGKVVRKVVDPLARGGGDAGTAAGRAFSDSFGRHVRGAAKTLGKGLALGFGAATAAAGLFAKSAIDAGRGFDESMSQVAATMGKSVDEVQDLRDFAKEMGKSTKFTASEAADALNYMALAGYDATTSMDMLPTVLNLAAAGSIDLASASDMVTDVQSALGLSLDETTQLVDKMAAAASKSNTSVAQLGSAMLTVGGTARTMSGGTTEAAQALGLLADNGIKGSEGGTALRNILLSLSNKKFAETFGEGGEAGSAADFGTAMANAINGLVPILQLFAPILGAAASAIVFFGNNADWVVPIAVGLGAAFAAIKAAVAISTGITAVSTALGLIGGTGAAAGAGLGATAAGETAAGTAAAAAGPSLLEVGGAVALIGVGVLLAAAGMWVLAQAAATLAEGGPVACEAMGMLVVAILALGAGAATAGLTLAAGAMTLAAGGAALLGEGGREGRFGLLEDGLGGDAGVERSARRRLVHPARGLRGGQRHDVVRQQDAVGHALGVVERVQRGQLHPPLHQRHPGQDRARQRGGRQREAAALLDERQLRPEDQGGAHGQRCVYAYEMRRRGYDVTALPRPENDRIMAKDGWRHIFAGMEWCKCDGNGLSHIERQMSEWGDGGHAVVYVKWKDSLEAHVFIAEQVGEKTVFVDPQTGQVVDHYFERVVDGMTELARIDDKDPTALIVQCCTVVDDD